MPNGVWLVLPVATMEFLCLFAQPGLVSPDFQRNVMTITQNRGDVDVTLPCGTSIGILKTCAMKNLRKSQP
jgi:hypothetical protein